MRAEGAGIRLAATDISNHLSAGIRQLDRAVAEAACPPSWRDPALALLQEVSP
jgi:hypothetical protein